jgi:hypothetical protein
LHHQLLSALKLFFTGIAKDATALLQEVLADLRPTSKLEDMKDIRITSTMFFAPLQ